MSALDREIKIAHIYQRGFGLHRLEIVVSGKGISIDTDIRIDSEQADKILEACKQWDILNRFKHLSTDKMLELGIIDETDQHWIEPLRQAIEGVKQDGDAG